MANNTIQDALREQLHRLFSSAKDRAGNREVAINCPLCAREGRPDKGQHMYISLGYNDSPPLMYNCFRNMDHHGQFSISDLEQLSDYPQYIDTDLYNKVCNLSKRVSQINRYRLNENKKLSINNTIYTNINKEMEIKRQYINNRLGIQLSYKDLADNKIIISLLDFLNMNYINIYTRSQYTMQLLDRFFIGFLTNNNSTVIMRNVDNKNCPDDSICKLRYIKYTIPTNPIDSGYYIIPSKCDIFKPISIYLAEGPMDILSIFYNIHNADRINKVYCSIGGNTYKKAIQYFISELGIIDCAFHIYLDNDISNYMIMDVVNTIKPLGYEIYLHNNIYEGEKDYGVPKDRIIDNIRKV